MCWTWNENAEKKYNEINLKIILLVYTNVQPPANTMNIAEIMIRYCIGV